MSRIINIYSNGMIDIGESVSAIAVESFDAGSVRSDIIALVFVENISDDYTLFKCICEYHCLNNTVYEHIKPEYFIRCAIDNKTYIINSDLVGQFKTQLSKSAEEANILLELCSIAKGMLVITNKDEFVKSILG